MQLILNNPYRTVGLLVGTTAKEQIRQTNKLKMYLDAEQEPETDYSFPILGELNRTLQDVNEASSKLHLDNDKINAALFWFWYGNPISDEAAFDALKDGDYETAYQIWDKLITETNEEGNRFWKQITEKNYSAYHNCSIINLIKANGNLHNAVMSNLYFLENDLVTKFVSDITDETYNTTKKELQLLFLNQLQTEIEVNNTISLVTLLEILNKQEFVAKQDFFKFILKKPIEQIKQKIETAKNKRTINKANGAKAGQELFEVTSNDLKQLKSIISTNDIKYSSIADKVANEILQCSIDYFNESKEKDINVDYNEIAMRLAKLAESIAIGNITKDRIKDSISALEEMKDREISQAIDLLKSVKDTYETNKAKINADILTTPLGYNQTINWSKVNEMIENSVDWDKVVDLILKIIPQKNIEKIKNTKKPSLINEYKNLVIFLLEKLNNSNKKQVNYLCFWETLSSTNKTSTKQIDQRQESTTNSNKNENILLLIGIIFWIIMIATNFGGDLEGSPLFLIAVVWGFYFSWNTPYIIIKKTIHILKNN